MISSEETNELHLKDYLRILRKRKWIIAAFFVIVLAVTALKTFTEKPVFMATALIQIEMQTSKMMSFNELFQLDRISADYYNTQLKILKSRTLAEKVLLVSGKNPEEALRLVPSLLGRMNVQPVSKSQLINLNMYGTLPEETAELANAWAQAYIDQNLEERFSNSSQAVGWLSKKVEELQEKVKNSEFDLQNYKEANNIISLEQRQGAVVNELSELNSSLVNAMRRRTSLGMKRDQLKKMFDNSENWETLTDLTESAIVEELEKELIKVKREKEELSFVYKLKHPTMLKMDSKIGLLKKQLQEAIQNYIQRIKNDYEIAYMEEKTLKKALNERKEEAFALNKKAIQYKVLKRELEGNSKLFDTLLSRLKETSLTGEIAMDNARIVDYAEVPSRPIRPDKLKNMMMAVIIGLFGGAAIALIIEYLDDTIKSSADVENILGLPYLGSVPDFITKEVDTSYLVSQQQPRSKISEAFRGLRTAVLFSSSKGLRSVMVTSSSPSEGKTTTAINLAITMAHGGKRVLLVDCDMRKPSLHKIFELPKGSSMGLSNVLVNETVDVKEAIVKTEIENMDVIPCGPIPPNPSELLSSSRMVELIDYFKDIYDRVIFDSPPVMSVTDATVLGGLVDGTLLVIDSRRTTKEAALSSKRSLVEVGSHVIGAVLNRVDLKGRGYYPYYYYYEYGDESA